MFRQFADIYKERHVFAKKLAIGKTIDYRLKPIIEYFGDRPLAVIRTADVEDFITDLRKPRIAGRRKTPRVLAAASINRTIEILRHMMNWAVGREYIERTPFRRGTETLVRKLREDNQRRRRIAEDEEARLLVVAPPLLRSTSIAALDTGMRQGEMLALRFKDVDFARGLITLRGETTKSRRTRFVPIATARLRAVSCQRRFMRRNSAWHSEVSAVQLYDFHTGATSCAFSTAVTHVVLNLPTGSPASSLNTGASAGFFSPAASSCSHSSTSGTSTLRG
jgi:integrase